MITHAGTRAVSPNRVIGAVFGAIYVLVVAYLLLGVAGMN